MAVMSALRARNDASEGTFTAYDDKRIKVGLSEA